MQIDFRKIVGHYDPQRPALDPTTPWCEWNSYCECCRSLNAPGQPELRRFLAFQSYLKSIEKKPNK